MCGICAVCCAACTWCLLVLRSNAKQTACCSCISLRTGAIIIAALFVIVDLVLVALFTLRVLDSPFEDGEYTKVAPLASYSWKDRAFYTNVVKQSLATGATYVDTIVFVEMLAYGVWACVHIVLLFATILRWHIVLNIWTQVALFRLMIIIMDIYAIVFTCLYIPNHMDYIICNIVSICSFVLISGCVRSIIQSYAFVIKISRQADAEAGRAPSQPPKKEEVSPQPKKLPTATGVTQDDKAKSKQTASSNRMHQTSSPIAEESESEKVHDPPAKNNGQEAARKTVPSSRNDEEHKTAYCVTDKLFVQKGSQILNEGPPEPKMTQKQQQTKQQQTKQQKRREAFAHPLNIEDEKQEVLIQVSNPIASSDFSSIFSQSSTMSHAAENQPPAKKLLHPRPPMAAAPARAPAKPLAQKQRQRSSKRGGRGSSVPQRTRQHTPPVQKRPARKGSAPAGRS